MRARSLRGLVTILAVGFVCAFVALHAAALVHRERTGLGASSALAARYASASAAARSPRGRSTVAFAASFPQHGLVTNEYAYWNARKPDAVRSPYWNVTSGSLFARAGAGWTGIPDALKPDARSAHATGSAIFRMTTKPHAFDNVAVSFDLRNLGYVSTPLTPARAWDGVHIFLHYRSQYALYYLSVNRRDNTVVIKKKVPGGPSNGGTYYSISKPVAYVAPLDRWQHIEATISSNPDGSVTIRAIVDARQLLEATDRGAGGPPLTGAGAVGIRGDNDNFEFAHFRVTRLT